MKHQTDHHRCFPSMTGCSVVKMVVLLMLMANLTAATPLRSAERREVDTVFLKSIQKLKDLLSLHSTAYHANTDRVFDNKDTESYHSGDANLRAKRAPPRGCQLGTCQMHNLADTLYRIGNTNGKDESKKANDPKGYGR